MDECSPIWRGGRAKFRVECKVILNIQTVHFQIHKHPCLAETRSHEQAHAHCERKTNERPLGRFIGDVFSLEAGEIAQNIRPYRQRLGLFKLRASAVGSMTEEKI